MDMETINDDILDVDIIPAPVGQGSLLVAEPYLEQQCFRHAVISLITCDDSPLGVVLNHRMEHHLCDALDEAVGIAAAQPLYAGGPVGSDRLLYVHTLGDIIDDSTEYSPGLWVGGDTQQIIDYINDSGEDAEGRVRFLVGYSGWGDKQLQDELDEHVWAVAPTLPARELLTGWGDAYWHKIVRAMGPHYRRWLAHPADLRSN